MVASLKDRIAETHSLLEALTIVARHADSSGVIKVASSSLHGTVMFSQGRLLSASVPKGTRKGRKALDKLLTLTDAGIRYRAATDLSVKPDERLDLDINELLAKYPPVTIAELPEAVANVEADAQAQLQPGALPDSKVVEGKPARKTKAGKAKPEKAIADKTAAEKPAAEKPAAEKPAAEKPAVSEKTSVATTKVKKEKTTKARTAKEKIPKAEEPEQNLQALQGGWAIPEGGPPQNADSPDVEIPPDLAVTLVEKAPTEIEERIEFPSAEVVAAEPEPVAAGQDKPSAERKLAGDSADRGRSGRQIAIAAPVEQRREPQSQGVLAGVVGIVVVCALCAAISMMPKAIRDGARATSGIQYGASQLRSLIEDESAEITPSTSGDVISGKVVEQSPTEAGSAPLSADQTRHHSHSHHRRRGL